MKTIIVLIALLLPSMTLALPPEASNKPLISSTHDLIALYADKYNVSASTMRRVIKCESNNNPKAVGDHGHSYGLSQIHLPSHPNITKAQAFDREFAIEYLAKNLAKGNGKQWTCYRNLIQYG